MHLYFQVSQGVKEINSNSKNYPVPYATTSVQKEPSDSLIDFSSSGNVSIYRRPAPGIAFQQNVLFSHL